MAEVAAPGSLGDFFAKNKKKKIKGSNLNTDAPKPSGDEPKGKATKDKEDGDWKDEEHGGDTGLKVQVAGKLLREDEKKDEDDHAAPAWKTKKTEPKNSLDDRRFPTLRKAVGQSSNINIDDGSNATVNIKTSKNVFSALHDDDDDVDEDVPKRPKEIKPFLAQKQKGEMMSSVIQREADKYGAPVSKSAAAPAKNKKKAKEVVESSDSEDSSDEESKDAKKKKAKEVKKGPATDKVVEQELEEDAKIVPDLEASRRKYQGREKLPKRKLPASELEAEKENRPIKQEAPVAGGAGKKGKKKNFAEEEIKPKMMVAPDDW